MKNKIYIALVLCFVLIVTSINLTVAYKNETSLYYDGRSKEFTYFNTNGSGLFSGFKDLMPGDKKEQIINVKLNNVKDKTIMYIKVLTDINDDELLNKININIYKNDEIIFNGEEGKENIIKLHEFNKNDNFDLKIELSIPEELGNEISNLTKNLDLEFMVNVNDELINVPKTYDDSNIIINFIIMSISLIILIILIFLKKQKKKK